MSLLFFLRPIFDIGAGADTGDDAWKKKHLLHAKKEPTAELPVFSKQKMRKTPLESDISDDETMMLITLM